MPDGVSLSKAELIIHPVRLRIIEVVQGRALTSQQISTRLPDVAQATLYRQIKRLVEGQVLAVVEERSVNGIIEKTYTLRENAAHFSREEFAKITAEDHSRYFAVFLGALSSRMTPYLQQQCFDTTEDGMSYFQAMMHLTDEEARLFRLDMLELVAKTGDRSLASPGERRLRTLGVAFIPESRDVRDTELSPALAAVHRHDNVNGE